MYLDLSFKCFAACCNKINHLFFWNKWNRNTCLICNMYIGDHVTQYMWYSCIRWEHLTNIWRKHECRGRSIIMYVLRSVVGGRVPSFTLTVPLSYPALSLRSPSLILGEVWHNGVKMQMMLTMVKSKKNGSVDVTKNLRPNPSLPKRDKKDMCECCIVCRLFWCAFFISFQVHVSVSNDERGDPYAYDVYVWICIYIYIYLNMCPDMYVLYMISSLHLSIVQSYDFYTSVLWCFA